MTIVAARLTVPTAAAGASGRSRCERDACRETDDRRGDDGKRQRLCKREQADREAADHEARLDDPRSLQQAPARGPRHHAEEEHEPTHQPRDVGRLAAAALQQRRHPVPEHDREPERGRVHDAERQQSSVERPRSALSARRAAVGRREQHEHETGRGHDRRGCERGAPPGPQRHQCERKPARSHRRRAVEALRDGRGEGRADVVGSADERGGQADAGDEPDPDREPRVAPREARQ
jgi:hypothetical protein